MGRPERSILMIGGGIVAIVSIAILVVVWLGEPEPEVFPPDSPEGALQRYLQAARVGDEEQIEGLLSEDARADLPPGSPKPYDCFVREDGRQVKIDRVERDGDRAVVYLTIEQVSTSGLTLDRYSYQQTVRLAHEDGEWKIDQPFFCF